MMAPEAPSIIPVILPGDLARCPPRLVLPRGSPSIATLMAQICAGLQRGNVIFDKAVGLKISTELKVLPLLDPRRGCRVVAFCSEGIVPLACSITMFTAS